MTSCCAWISTPSFGGISQIDASQECKQRKRVSIVYLVVVAIAFCIFLPAGSIAYAVVSARLAETILESTGFLWQISKSGCSYFLGLITAHTTRDKQVRGVRCTWGVVLEWHNGKNAVKVSTKQQKQQRQRPSPGWSFGRDNGQVSRTACSLCGLFVMVPKDVCLLQSEEQTVTGPVWAGQDDGAGRAQEERATVPGLVR